MTLTRLKNIITSRTGRIIYVNPDDFDALIRLIIEVTLH